METDQLRGKTTSYSVLMVTEVCITCGIPFSIPQSFKEHLKRSHEVFYCPNGHNQYYPAKTDAEVLKEKLHERENELANQQTKVIQLESQLNKVAQGKCPCCGKVFKCLQKHMATKHPNQNI